MKYPLQIYIVPPVDWYQYWRNWLSSFGGEANTTYYPSEKKICDGWTDGWTDVRTEGHVDYYMAPFQP